MVREERLEEVEDRAETGFPLSVKRARLLSSATALTRTT